MSYLPWALVGVLSVPAWLIAGMIGISAPLAAVGVFLSGRTMTVEVFVVGLSAGVGLGLVGVGVIDYFANWAGTHSCAPGLWCLARARWAAANVAVYRLPRGWYAA
jgi:hypothetical protein